MKLLIIIILGMSLMSCAVVNSGSEKLSLKEQFSTTQNALLVNVKGMVCDYCVQGLKKKFGAMTEVENIEVELMSGDMLIRLRDGKELSDKVITKAVEENGQEVVRISR